jgi:membrane-bound hydrogenase subunit beta
MSDAAIIERLRTELGHKALDITNPDVRRIFLRVAPEDLPATAAILRDRFDMAYLAAVSGLDLGAEFEILYHFASPVTTVNVRTRVPRESPRLPSICAVIPGAVYYERELQDMFGLVIEGLPDPRPLLLADDWPAGQHPLRKDWKHERPREIIPGGTS